MFDTDSRTNLFHARGTQDGKDKFDHPVKTRAMKRAPVVNSVIISNIIDIFLDFLVFAVWSRLENTVKAILVWSSLRATPWLVRYLSFWISKVAEFIHMSQVRPGKPPRALPRHAMVAGSVCSRWTSQRSEPRLWRPAGGGAAGRSARLVITIPQDICR